MTQLTLERLKNGQQNIANWCKLMETACSCWFKNKSERTSELDSVPDLCSAGQGTMKIHLPQSCTHYMQTDVWKAFGTNMDKCQNAAETCWYALRTQRTNKQTNKQPSKRKNKDRNPNTGFLLNIAALLRMLSLFSSRTGGTSWSAEDLSRLAEYMFPRRLGNVAVSNTHWNWRKGHFKILPSRCSLWFVRVPWIKDVSGLRRVPCRRSSEKIGHMPSNSHLYSDLQYNIIIDIFYCNWQRHLLNHFIISISIGLESIWCHRFLWLQGLRQNCTAGIQQGLDNHFATFFGSGCHAQSLCLDERHYMRLPCSFSDCQFLAFICFSCLVGSFIGPLKVLTNHTLGALNKQRSSQQILNLGTFSLLLFDQVTNRQG